MLLRAPVRFWLDVSACTGSPLCRCERSALTTKRRPGDVGLVLMRAIFATPSVEPPPSLLDAGEVDRLALRELHVGLLEIRAPARAAAETLRLAGDVHDLHGIDLDLEHQLDGRLDLGLRRVTCDAKDDLVALIGDTRAFL